MCVFSTFAGGPVTVQSFDLGQVWHSNGWASLTPGHIQTHTHTQPLTHSLTLFLSPLCMHLCTQAHTLALSAQPGLMLAKSNFELTYKYQRFKLLHMALNPIHSNDTLTSHYPVGKYASHSLCTMTSSAMFVKDISSMFFFVSLHTFHFLTSL